MTNLSLADHPDPFVDFLAARYPQITVPSGLRSDSSGSISNAIWRQGQLGAGELADSIASFYELPRETYDTIAAHPSTLVNLSRRYLREAHAFPFERDDGRITVAIADPGRAETVRALKLALGADISLCVASYEDIDLLFEKSVAEPATSEDTRRSAAEAAHTVESLDTLQDLARGAPVVRMIDQVLERAVEIGATDVHFETERDNLNIRLRVDGFLRTEQTLPLSMAAATISRLKILASLDIADRRLPQDGRAVVRVRDAEADLRVATMPTMHGESAVLRILMRDTRLLDFGRIGMTAEDQSLLGKLLEEPNGIIIVTGPTGSGKTTTLATAISILNDPSRKIVTIEDPVEYQIPGVHQTQLKASIGLSFASALRSFLRHDPDVIMVGEMRDHETASVGVQAALTGHLVLTTLHTNSAADAVVRLTDMGVEPYLLGASMRGVVGQRLVRRLCDRCKVEDPQAASSVSALAKSRSLSVTGCGSHFKPRGCEACGHTGFRGRIGIFEIMPVDDGVRDLIRTGGPTGEMIRAAKHSGMSLMLEDGLNKCAQGLTSLNEVLRATG